MHRSRTRRAGDLGASILALALLVPAGVAHAAAPETLVIHQDRFDVAVHDLGGDGVGPGDLYTWVAPATTTDGRTGTVVGEHRIVVMPTDGPFREVRIGTSLIDLGNGDTFALGGLIPVTTPLGQIEPGTELVNAIIGGTGAFGGAKGEILSVRGEDGSWSHTLTYRTADLAAPERTLGATWAVDVGAADRTVDGTVGLGDLRVGHWVGTTDDGQAVDAMSSNVLLRDPGEDGAPIPTFGYWLASLDGDLIAGTAAAQIPSPTGGVVTVSTPIVGGVGRYAGATGWFEARRQPDGSLAGAYHFLTPPADTVERTLVLRTGIEPARVTDRGEAGESLGDQRSWALRFTGDDGESGTAYGYAETAAPASDGTAVRTVLGLIVIEFADGSTILVGNLHTEEAAVPRAIGTDVARPVLGGTGRFAGVSGELVTTLDGEGGLVHTLTLRGPAA